MVDQVLISQDEVNDEWQGITTGYCNIFKVLVIGS
jgi:hypothetical protein